jgi:hypothetical protein
VSVIVLGNTTVGGKSSNPSSPEVIRALPLTPSEATVLREVRVAADTIGSVSPAVMRPVVYTPAGELIVQGDDAELEPGAPVTWVPLRFGGAAAGRVLNAYQQYLIGVHFHQELGSGGAMMNTYYGAPAAGETTYVTSSGVSFYPASPATATFSAPGVSALALYALGLPPVALPDAADDYLSTLPRAEAQRALGGTVTGDRMDLATCGWHGTRTDPVRGFGAVVRRDGPLADLVGERLRVTVGRFERVAYVYARSAGPVLEDLSLSREAFQLLGPLAAEYLDVSVEPVA